MNIIDWLFGAALFMAGYLIGGARMREHIKRELANSRYDWTK